VNVAASPTFSIAVSPTSLSVAPGQSVVATVTITSTAGFDSPVSLGVVGKGCPSMMEITCTFAPNVGILPFTSTLTIATASSTPAGTYTVTFIGSGVESGASTPTSQQVSVALTVLATTSSTATIGTTASTTTVTTFASTPVASVKTSQTPHAVNFRIDPQLAAAYILMEDSNNSIVGRFTDGQLAELTSGIYHLYAPTTFGWGGNWSFAGAISNIGYGSRNPNDFSYIPRVDITVVGNGDITLTLSRDQFLSSWNENGESYVQSALYVSNISPNDGDSITVAGALVNGFGNPVSGRTVEFSIAIDRNVTTDQYGTYSFSALVNITKYHCVLVASVYSPTISSVITPFCFNWPSLNTPHPSEPALFYDCESCLPSTTGSKFFSSFSPFLNLTTTKNAVVVYLSGGGELPVLSSSYSGSPYGSYGTNYNDTSFLRSQGFGTAILPYQIADYPDDLGILAVGSLLKYGLGYRTFVVGWSAGGTVAAYTLVHDIVGSFDGCVILDGELLGPTSGSTTHTDWGVFNTARFSSSVKIPHILIYGKNDAGARAPAVGAEWMRHAQSSVARLDIFDYGHDWLNSPARQEVEQDIVSFLDNLQVGGINEMGGVRILSNSVVSGLAYYQGNGSLQFTVSGANGTAGSINVVIPKNVTYGKPAVSFDGSFVDALNEEDGRNYYIFYSYLQTEHTIAIRGLSITAVPEFPGAGSFISLLFLLLVSEILVRRRRKKGDHRPLQLLHLLNPKAWSKPLGLNGP
jgi:hypothetical protein